MPYVSEVTCKLKRYYLNIYKRLTKGACVHRCLCAIRAQRLGRMKGKRRRQVRCAGTMWRPYTLLLGLRCRLRRWKGPRGCQVDPTKRRAC
jgi:hypothetical protein